MDYKRTVEWWDEHVHLSGEELARQHGGDGAHWRRAKRNYLSIVSEPEDECDALDDYGLIPAPSNGPAILVYDIETAPALAWVWSQWNTNAIALEQDWYMLSFAYKWLNDDRIGFVSVFQDPEFYPDTVDDRYVAERLAALFDRADAIIAHNGDKFDRRKANQRFLKWDIEPPSPYKSIDTKKIVTSEFAHMSNSLAELGRVHELGGKTPHTGFELWRSCMRGDSDSWKLMEKYNRQDVVLLEQVYIKLLPWMSLPGKAATINYGFWAEGGTMVCPNCGHDHLTQKGVHRTLVSEFKTYQCDRCKTYSRFRKREPQDNGGVQLV